MKFIHQFNENRLAAYHKLTVTATSKYHFWSPNIPDMVNLHVLSQIKNLSNRSLSQITANWPKRVQLIGQ